MSGSFEDLKLYLKKCRCCLEDFQQGDTLKGIDEDVETLFLELTKIEVNNLLSLMKIDLLCNN